MSVVISTVHVQLSTVRVQISVRSYLARTCTMNETRAMPTVFPVVDEIVATTISSEHLLPVRFFRFRAFRVMEVVNFRRGRAFTHGNVV